MTTLNKIVAGAIFTVATVNFAIGQITLPAKSTFDSMLKAVKKNDIERAYNFTSSDFRKNTNEKAFKEFVTINRFADVKNFQVLERKTGSLEGKPGSELKILLRQEGQTQTFKTLFIKRQRSWKIYGMTRIAQTQNTANAETENPDTVPSDTVLIKMANKAMVDFAKSIEAKDMTRFRNETAFLFQNSVSLEQFNTGFKVFMDMENNNFMATQKQPFTFVGKPSINADGELVLNGEYATRPSKVVVTSRYAFEGSSWKLVSYHINVTPAEKAKAS